MYSTYINLGDGPRTLVLARVLSLAEARPCRAEDTAKCQIRAVCHDPRMTWRSFDIMEADVRSVRGFELLGRLVRRRRQGLMISQRQLERLSGVDQTIISRLENGRLAGLRWSRFGRLVDALGGLGETDPLPVWTGRFLLTGHPPTDDR